MLAVKQRFFTCSGQRILQLRLQQCQRAVLIRQPRLHGTLERLPDCPACWHINPRHSWCCPTLFAQMYVNKLPDKLIVQLPPTSGCQRTCQPQRKYA